MVALFSEETFCAFVEKCINFLSLKSMNIYTRITFCDNGKEREKIHEFSLQYFFNHL
jgi:hypothetical protein